MSGTSAIERLVERHLATLAADNTTWQTLIDDAFIWEFPYATAIGLPAKIEGREQVIQFVHRFVSEVVDFTFHDPRVWPYGDGTSAVVEVSATARFRATGRDFAQNYVLFIETRHGKISRIREYFDPVRLARALGLPTA